MSAVTSCDACAEVRRTACHQDSSVALITAHRGRPRRLRTVCQGEAVTQTPEPQLDELTRLMREFSDARDWGQFQDPKSLILALVGEVGELAELFQWIPADDVVAHFADPARHTRAGEEIADVLLYLLRLADVLDIDVMEAARAKQAGARERFPVEQVHGAAPEKA